MKTKVKSLKDLTDWAFDGSSTWQAESAATSEVTLKPVAYFKDPFRGGNNVLVLCDTYVKKSKDSDELVPANTNFRYYAKKIFDATKDEHPTFGFEQEYTMLEVSNTFQKKPIGWPSSGFPSKQGPYYCAVGANHVKGRSI